MVALAGDIRFVGIAIGATGLSVGVTDGQLEVVAAEQIAYDIRQGPDVVLKTALDRVRLLLDDHRGRC